MYQGWQGLPCMTKGLMGPGPRTCGNLTCALEFVKRILGTQASRVTGFEACVLEVWLMALELGKC